MDHNAVAVGVGDDGELADRGGHDVGDKNDAARFEPRNLRVKIVRLERDARAVRRRLPDITVAADAERAAADFIFHPHTAGGFHGRLETEHAFVKFARAFDVCDWRAGECDFSEHNFYFLIKVDL